MLASSHVSSKMTYLLQFYGYFQFTKMTSQISLNEISPELLMVSLRSLWQEVYQIPHISFEDNCF